MDRLRELLAELERISELDGERLEAIAAELATLTDELLDSERTDEVLAALRQAAEAAEAVNAELTTRDEAQAARDTEAEELAGRIRAATGNGDPEPDGDPADPPADPPADGPADPPADAPGAAAPQPVAAGAGTTMPARSVRLGRARRPATSVAPVSPNLTAGAEVSLAGMGLTAGANAPGIVAGSAINDGHQLAIALMDAWDNVRSMRQGADAKIVVARSGPGEGGIGRAIAAAAGGLDLMTSPSDPEQNQRVFRNARKALAAAGGICAPRPVRYDLPVVGSTRRPVRDEAFVTIGAERGGVRVLPSPTLANVGAGIGLWTQANDASPAMDAATPPAIVPKPCVELDCPSESESLVDAITECLKYSNFRAKFFPEQIDAWMNLLDVAKARRSEEELLKDLDAGASVQVTGGEVLGATVDFATHLRRLLAGIRDRFRVDDGTRWTLVEPAWLYDLMVTDLMRRMPAHGTQEEDLVIREATITAMFNAVNVTPVWTLDRHTSGQYIGAQGNGAITAYPATNVGYLYPTGDWNFLDAGELRLGVLRVGNDVGENQVRFFAETFEGSVRQGPIPTHRLTFTLDPNGTASALTALASGM